MVNRGGIFHGDDPIEIISRWLETATETEPNDANAMALATVDADGLPNVRMVLLKDIEPEGFVFYTNYGSKKAQEIASGKAAFVVHWKSLRRQVRARGLVEKEDGPQADDYYKSRSPKSRLGAWASDQSKPLEDRETLMAKVAEMEAEKGCDPDRPPFWGGFRIVPLEIELWADGEARLHDRFRWTRSAIDAPWEVTRLYP
jgi:pyridoxamine 5'-phosphate oxidase